MKYYLKKAGTFEVQGPFRLEEVNRRIAIGELDSHWLAASDLGETLEKIRNAPEDEWCWLAEIPGVAGLAVPEGLWPKTSKESYRTAQVSLFLILIGFLNLLVFIVAYAAGRGAPDFQGLPAAMVSVGSLILSGFLYATGLMCTGYAMKAKQHVSRSIAGMIAGGSALIWWFLMHVVRAYGQHG